MALPPPNPSGLPFDDIRDLLHRLPEADMAAVAAVKARDAELTKPAGSLGRLEEIVEWVAAWSANPKPRVDRPLVAIFATAHGVTAQGISAFPDSVNRQMLENFAAGGAAINQLCVANDIGLKVFDLAIDLPTPDISVEDALDEPGCAATIAFGMEAIAGGTDLLCLGEMGIGNTTVAAAIYLALYGGRPEDWIGPGTGVDAEGLKRKAEVVARAVQRSREHLSDPLEVLRRVGGREIAALVGAILAARLQRIPVLLDGYVVTAAAAILHALEPASLDHCLAAHRSAEPAHGRVLERIGKRPLFDFSMRLGEASGAALACGIVKNAVAVHNGMATFEQAAVSRKAH
ncbi:Nicotinate-nucleotide--dimethylbenzimidazole phosphoribosyltransferase [bacterium YEK0313]|nr:Nicotinate-nucleotide--dimethylbenzimidazole phosphoribosyltransferase [bacterium YEK0313]